MKQLFLLVLLPFLLVSRAQASDTLSVVDPWIPEAPPGVQVMAGYMKLVNNTLKPVQVTRASSADFEKVEMHLSKEVDGVARMLPQESLKIEAGQTLELRAGSYHLMLINPTRPLKDGDSVKINLETDSGDKVEFESKIRKNRMPANGGMKCGAGKCGGGK